AVGPVATEEVRVKLGSGAHWEVLSQDRTIDNVKATVAHDNTSSPVSSGFLSTHQKDFSTYIPFDCGYISGCSRSSVFSMNSNQHPQQEQAPPPPPPPPTTTTTTTTPLQPPLQHQQALCALATSTVPHLP
ncbi:unnamed protein product, partial [Ectocarpus sp. 6 AP-2014]